MILRPYQQTAVEATFDEWLEHDSTLLVMPTGCGKTVVFSEIIRRMQPARALILAHRSELIAQAVKHVERIGLDAEIEMADMWAGDHLWNQKQVVVSTVQTQIAGNGGKGRMARFNPDDFGVLICDEAHHFTAKSFVKVLDHYRQNPSLKILGVTATPDRADEQSLGKVFQSVAYDYEILDAIVDGWLVPIQQQMVTIEELDFSQIRTTAGDLNGADLALVMETEKNLHGIVSATIDIIGNRRTLVFAVAVKQAERYAEIFNRHKPGMADWVCGKTPKDQRHETFRKFRSGLTQILVNVGVATEGYDNPYVEVIVQARPTKSRCLYSQMVGRATRPLPGQVDGLETPEERRASIAASIKPTMLVIDFVGNSGRHKLITTADILGGKVSDEAIARAVAKAKQKGTALNMAEAVQAEERIIREEVEAQKRREAARRAKVVGMASFSSRSIDPFNAFHLEPVRERGWDKNKSLSEKQANLLRRQGIDPAALSYAQGRQVIAELFKRWDGHLATLKQCALLQKHGYDTKELTIDQAKNMIDALAKNGWRRPEVAA
ncbi:MAG: DEAD/DEAH box helicase [Pyrinomonadaceae bacterium]